MSKRKNDETAEIPRNKLVTLATKTEAVSMSSDNDLVIDDLLGKKLGRYRIESCLGKGSMGIVYLARESFLKRNVAIKVLSPKLTKNPESVEKFKREGRLLAMLNHPNITSIYLFDEQDGLYYFVFEYVRGDTLDKILQKKHRLSLRDSSKIISQICKALQHAHKLGIIHRDIKPSNIMLDSMGRVKVTDFGLAVHSKSLLDGTDTISGTPHYISPEQIKAQSISPATDIYSTGILFYQMLTGEIPFKGNRIDDVFQQHLNKALPQIAQSVRTIPTGVEKIIRKMTEKDPELRYESAVDVIKELEQYKAASPNKSSFESDAEEVRFETEYEEFDSEYDDKKVALIRVAGSLEASSMERVTNDIKTALNNNIYRIIIDFERLNYINSSGMSMFLPFVDQVRNNSGEMIFIKLSDKIFKVFELLGLNNIYVFHATLNNALKEFLKVKSETLQALQVFPFSYLCTLCSRYFKIPSQGKFNCPYCSSTFYVSPQGHVNSEKKDTVQPYLLRVPAIGNSLGVIRGAFRGLFVNLEFSQDDQYKIIQAVDEACSNVIAYASKGSENFEIELICYATKRRIEIQILDRGEIFNPLEKAPVDVGKRFQLKKVGGIGLELIKKCMTTVEYSELPEGGNKLTLIKEASVEE